MWLCEEMSQSDETKDNYQRTLDIWSRLPRMIKGDQDFNTAKIIL